LLEVLRGHAEAPHVRANVQHLLLVDVEVHVNRSGSRKSSRIKALRWQTYIRSHIERQRLFRPLANPGEVEASCVFRALMHYEVKQRDLRYI
jgi:hypothetical protein